MATVTPRAPKAPPPGPRKRTRRDLILDEAARQFNRRGVSLASLKQVSAALGLTREALYYYVRDREDLVFQCYLRTGQVLNAHLDRAAQADTAARAIARFIEAVLGPAEPELCAPTETGLLKAEQLAAVLDVHEGAVHKLAGVLDRGIGSGEFRPLDVDVIARSILSMIFWLPFSEIWLSGEDKPLPPGFPQSFTDFVLNGAAADRSGMPTYVEVDVSPLQAPPLAAWDKQALTEAKREGILLIASQLFNAKGLDAPTLEEIAGRFGATPRALYHYVGDKETLISECYARTYGMALRLFRSALAQNGSSLGASAAQTQAWAEVEMTQELSPVRPIAGFDALSAESKQRTLDLGRAFETSWRERAEPALAAGEYRNVDFATLQRVLPGASTWLSRAQSSDPDRRRAVGREIAALLTLGIGALDA